MSLHAPPHALSVPTERVAGYYRYCAKPLVSADVSVSEVMRLAEEILIVLDFPRSSFATCESQCKPRSMFCVTQGYFPERSSGS